MTTFINACNTFETAVADNSITHVYAFKNTTTNVVTVCVLPDITKPNGSSHFAMDFTTWNEKVATVQHIAHECFFGVANYKVLMFSDFAKDGKAKPLASDRKEICKIFFEHYLKYSKAYTYYILLFEEKSAKRFDYKIISGNHEDTDFINALTESLEISTKSDGKGYSLRLRVNGTKKFEMFKPFTEKVIARNDFEKMETELNYPKNAVNNGLKWEYMIYSQNNQKWEKDNREFFNGADIIINSVPTQLKTQKSTFAELDTFKNNTFLTWTD